MRLQDLNVFAETSEMKVLSPQGLALLIYALVTARTDFDDTSEQDEVDALFSQVEDTLING